MSMTSSVVGFVSLNPPPLDSRHSHSVVSQTPLAVGSLGLRLPPDLGVVVGLSLSRIRPFVGSLSFLGVSVGVRWLLVCCSE